MDNNIINNNNNNNFFNKVKIVIVIKLIKVIRMKWIKKKMKIYLILVKHYLKKNWKYSGFKIIKITLFYNKFLKINKIFILCMSFLKEGFYIIIYNKIV